MPRLQTTKRERFLPHEYLKFGLEVRFPKIRLDDRSVEAGDPSRNLIDLTNSSFETLRIETSVTLPPELTSKPADQLAAILTLRCAKTRLRRAITLERVDSSLFRGELALDKREVWGSVELVPFALGDRGLRVASARAWELRVDRLREAPGGFLDIRYESFSTVGRPQFPHPNNMFQLEAQSEFPVLWLNRDHQEIQSVLSAVGHTGWRARAREVLFDHIEHMVTLELFWRIADLCRESDELPYDWQASLISRLLPPLFPEYADHASRLRALQEVLAEDQAGELFGRLAAHLQSVSNMPDHVNRLLAGLEA